MDGQGGQADTNHVLCNQFEYHTRYDICPWTSGTGADPSNLSGFWLALLKGDAASSAKLAIDE